MTLTSIDATIIGYYKRRSSQEAIEISLQEFLTGIESGADWKRHAEWVRECDPDAPKDQKDPKTGEATNEYDRRKAQSACVTIGGVFDGPKVKENLRKPSGYLAVDIDKLGNLLGQKKAELITDPHFLAVFVSIGGKGLCGIVPINPDRYEDAFDGLQVYLTQKFGLVGKQFDKSSRNVNRLRYVSHDAQIHVNLKAKQFTKYPSKQQKSAKIGGYVHTQDDIEYVIEQIEARSLEFHDTDGDWVRMGLALASKYDSAGRDYFQRISQFRHDYDADYTDKVYEYLCRNKRNEVTISTFYYLCKQAGLDIMTRVTKEVVSVAAMSKKQKISAKSALDTVLKMTDVAEEIARPIIDQVYESKEEFDTEETLFDQLELFLKQNYTLRYNEITHYIENDGKKLHDRERNDIYIAAAKTFDKLSKDNVFTILDSSAIHAYHPLKEFFVRNKARKGTGAIDALCASINHKMSGNYVEFFLRKFAVGMIGSIWGYQCPLMPIMCGEMGTGKTQFWRRYLPDELIEYYGECKFNRPGDDELLMCKKIILMSDDFDTAFLRNQTRFKNLTDAHTFSIRKPYGRAHEDLARLALLCGTSNETALIYDIDSNRRIIPILIDSFDYDAYNNIDKVDLLMEAYHAFHTYGEDGNLNAEQIRFLKKHTTQFVEVSTERDLVEKYFTIPTKKEDGELLSQGEILVYLSQHTGLKNLKPKLISQEMKSLGFVYSNGEYYAAEKRAKRGFWVYRTTLVSGNSSPM